MDTCEFSETQFSLFFTAEYMNSFPCVKLPVFPNTVIEGRKGGGFDVQINGNMFFQYKIPVFFGSTRSKYWKIFDWECYRIDVSTKKKQFDLLKDLKKMDRNNCVYYAAPKFHLEEDMFKYYSCKSIITNSAIFPIENFPDDGMDHCKLYYDTDCDYGIWHSEPVKVLKEKNINAMELFPMGKSISLYEQAHDIYKKLYQEPVRKFV